MARAQDADLKKYAMSGMAAFLPGMTYMVELMTKQLEEFRLQLAGMQGMEAMEAEPANGRRYPQKGGWSSMTAEERSEEMKRRRAVGIRKKSGWDGMSAEERSAEMVRRMSLWKAKRTAKPAAAPVPEAVGKPPGKGTSYSWVNKSHPDHAKWVAKMARMQAKRWQRMTRAQREEWKAKMVAGKAAKRAAA